MARAIVSHRSPPAAKPVTPSIRPTVIRGATYFAIGDVSFASVRQAATALSAVESHRLDIVDRLTVERAIALTEMRDAGSDLLRFRSASKREAFAAAQLREVNGNG